MFTVYEQRAPSPDPKKQQGKLVKFWMPEQAEQAPLVGIFDRQLANGDTLHPTHWVFLYLHDHPDIDDALISYRSKGNAIYKAFEKRIKTTSTLWTEMRWRLTSQSVAFKDYDTTHDYPDFEEVGRNFSFADNELVAVKGGMSKEEVRTVLSRADQLLTDYQANRMVSKISDISALINGKSAPALATPAGGYVDDDEEQVTF
jgi:hypothetical protein